MSEIVNHLKQERPGISYDFSIEEEREPCFSYREKELTLQKFEMTPQDLMTMSRMVYKDDDISVGEVDDSLKFDSNFECGNLYRVRQINPREYQLELRHDSGTNGHPQWYFFSCEGLVAGNEYRFNITNLLKKTSSYSFGLKPLVYYSQKRIWRRVGREILYRKTEVEREDGKFFHQLSFCYTPKEEELSSFEEKVYFCHHYPYTHSMLGDHLTSYERNERISNYFRRSELCTTSLGYSCEKVLIGDNMDNKNVIVIMARQHPGETTSSWKMKGVLDFLTDPDNEDAKVLRSKFLFFVIPMVNIDGTQIGNYRCSSIGEDLNRQWREPVLENNPVVYSVKKEMMRLQDVEKREIVFFLDLHGHSKTRDVFFYGNNSLNRDHKIMIRSFPKLMSKYCPNYFSYRNSSFKMGKKKRETARYVAYKELRIMHAYTCESSFCGASKGRFIGKHFVVGDYIEVGRLIMHYLLRFTNVESQEMKEILYELRLVFPISKVKKKKKKIVKRKQNRLQKRLGKKNNKFFTKKKKKITPEFSLVTNNNNNVKTAEELQMIPQGYKKRKRLLEELLTTDDEEEEEEEETEGELKLGITNVRNSPFLRKGIRRLDGGEGDSKRRRRRKRRNEWFWKKKNELITKQTVISFSLGIAAGVIIGWTIKSLKK